MGLREKVTLVLIAVALYETVCLCAPQSLNENPFEKYISKLKLGKNRLNSKYDSGNKLKNPRFQNELPDKNMYETHSDYTSDTSSRIPSYVQSTGYDSSGKTSAIGLSRDADSLNKFRKEKRKKRKNSPSTQTYTRDDMPVATVPESFHNHEPSFSLSENGLFPEVQYPLTASETWAPNYWNPPPANNEAANEDAYFMRGDSLNQNKRLKKKDFKSFLQSSAKGGKSILNTEDEITKVSLLSNVNNGKNNNELNKIIISEKKKPTLIKITESNKTVILNKPQKKKQRKIKTKKRLQPATSKKKLNPPKKKLSESQLSLNQNRNSTNSSSPSIIDSVSTVLKIEQLNEAPLLCKLEGNITDTLIEKTPDICFPSLTDTHSTSALEDTLNSDLLSERSSRLLPISYLDTNSEVDNNPTIDAVVNDPTSKETLSNDWTKLELLLTDTDSKLPVEIHRKKPIKEFKALQRKKLKDYPGVLTDDSVSRRIYDILLTKKISASSLKEKILKILQSEEQVSSDIVTEPQLTFIPQNVMQNISEFQIAKFANNTLKCNVVKATDNEKPCVDNDIYDSQLHNNLSNDDILEIFTSVKAISNLESVVAKKTTDAFEEVIPEISSSDTPVDNIIEIISHATACNDTCAVILNTSVVNDFNDLDLVPEKTKVISEASVEVVPKVSENSIDDIALPIVTELLSDNLRDVISNPSSSRVFIDDLREMIRLLTIWNSQFNETDEKILDSIVDDNTNTDLVNPTATINHIKHDAKTSENSSNLNLSYELTTDLEVVIPKTAATDSGTPQSSMIDTSEIIDDVIKEDNNKLTQKPTSNFSVISSHSLADDNTDFTEKPAIDSGENVDDALSENLAVDSSEMILNLTADDSNTIAEIPTVEVGKTPVKSPANSYDTPTKSPPFNIQEIILETLSTGTNREILNTVKDNHTINDTVSMIESWSSVPQAFTSLDMVLSLANEKEYNVSPTSFTKNNIPIPNTDKVTKQLTETNSNKTIDEPLRNNPITKATLNENFTADYGKADERITNQFITKDHSEPDIYYVGLSDDSSISDILSNKTIAYDYSKTVIQNSSKKIGPQFSSDITSDDLGDLNSNYAMYDSLTDTISTLENPSPLSDIFSPLTEEKKSEFPILYNKTLFSIQNKANTTQLLSNLVSGKHVQTGDENSSLNVCPITEETSFKNQCHWSDNLNDLNSTSNFTDIMAGKLQLNSDIEPTELPDISLIDFVMGYAPSSTPEAQFKTTSLPTVCNIDALLCDDEIPDFSDYTLSREDDTTADIIDNTVFKNMSYFDQFAYSLSLLNDTDYSLFNEAQSTSHIIKTPDFDDTDFTVEKDLTSKPKETHLDSSNTTDMVLLGPDSTDMRLSGPDSVTTNEPANERNPYNITDAETNDIIADWSSGEHNNTLTDDTFIKSSSDDTTTTLTDFDNEALSEEEPDKSNVGNAPVNETVQVKPITDIELNTLETPTATSNTRISDFDDGDSAVEFELTPKPFIHTQPSDLISKENAAGTNDTAFYFDVSSSGNETVFTYGLENHSENDTFDKLTSLITPNEDTANIDFNKPVDNLLMNYFDTIEANVAHETKNNFTLVEDITDSEKTSIKKYLDSSNTTDVVLVGTDSIKTNEPENELNPLNITDVETNDTIADFSSEEHNNTLADDTFKSSSNDTTATLPDLDHQPLSEEEPDKQIARDFAAEYELTSKPFIYTEPSDLISKENAAVINNTALNFVKPSSANETAFTYLYENSVSKDVFAEVLPEYEASRNLTDFTLANAFATSDEMSGKLDSNDSTLVLDECVDEFANHNENYTFDQLTSLITPDEDTADTDLNKPADNLLANNFETIEANVAHETKKNFTLVEDITDSEKTSIEKYLNSSNTTDVVLVGPDSVTTNEPENKPILDAETYDILADFSSQEHDNTSANDTFTKSSSDHTIADLTDFDNESLSEEETEKSNVHNASVNNTKQVKQTTDIELKTLETATTTSHTRIPDADDGDFDVEYELITKHFIYTQPSDLISKENAAVINDTTFHFVESSSGNETVFTYGLESHNENDTFDKLTSLITPNEDTANIDLNEPVDNLLMNYSDAIKSNVVHETKKKLTIVEVRTDSEKTTIETYLDSSNTTDMVMAEPDLVTTNEPENKPILDAETYDILADFSSQEHDNTSANDTFTKSSSDHTIADLTDFDNESLSEEETEKSNVHNASVNNTKQVKQTTDIELKTLETATTTSHTRIPDADDGDFDVEYELITKSFIYTQPSDLISKENAAVINDTTFHFVESSSGNETVFTYGLESHNENDTFDKLTSLITPNEDTANIDLNEPVDNLLMNYSDAIKANVVHETKKKLTIVEVLTDSEKTSIETHLDSSNTTEIVMAEPDLVTTNEPEYKLILDAETYDILADFSSGEHDNTLANDTFTKSSSDHTTADLTDFDNESLSEEETDKSNVDYASVNNTKQVKPITDKELNTLETATTTSHTRIPDNDDRDFAAKYELTSKSIIYTEPSDLISEENAAVINDTAIYFLESSSANETAFTYFDENSAPEEVFAEVLPEYEASRNFTDFTLANAFATPDEMSKELDSNESTLVPDDYVDEFANHNENDTVDQLTTLITPDEDTADTGETKENFTLAEDLTNSEKTNIEIYLDSSNTTDMRLSGPDSVATNDPQNELKPQNITDDVTNDIFAAFSSEEHDNTLTNGTFMNSSSDDTTAILTDFDNESLTQEEKDKSNVDNASVNNTKQVKPITDIQLNTLETATTTSHTRIPDVDDGDFDVEYELITKSFIYTQPSDLISKENAAVINETTFHFVESSSGNETVFTYGLESHIENDTFDKLISLITPNEDTANIDLNKPVDNLLMNYSDAIKANVVEETKKKLTSVEVITDSEKTSIETHLDSSNTTEMVMAEPDLVTTNEPENKLILDAETYDILADFSSEEHDNTLANDTFTKSSSDHTTANLTDFDNESLSEEEPDKSNEDNVSVNNTKQVNPITDIELNTLKTATTTSHTRIPDLNDRDFAPKYELTSKSFIYTEPSDFISKENAAVINDTTFYFLESSSANETAFTYLYENSVPEEVFAEVLPENKASRNFTDLTLVNPFATSDEMSRELDSNESTLVPDDYLDEFANHSKNDTIDQLTSLIIPEEDTTDTNETIENFTLAEDLTNSEKTNIEIYLDYSNTTDMVLAGPDSVTTNEPEKKLKSQHIITDGVSYDILAGFSLEEHDNVLANDTFKSSDDTTATLTDFDNKSLSEEETDKSNVDNASLNKTVLVKPITDIKLNKFEINHTIFNEVATEKSGSNDELTDNNDLDSNTDIKPLYSYEQEVVFDSKDYQMTKKLLDGQDPTKDLDDSDRFYTG